jgi:hypothetical protein
MLLSSELRKPIEKSACLAMTVRVIAYLADQGEQWDIAAAKR